MSVTARLDDLRLALPGCSLVVFGDLFSQVTLCVSARDKHPQEQLDAICVCAGNLLDGPVARSVALAMGMPDSDAVTRAVMFSPTFARLYLRSPMEQADVLCCEFSPNVDIEHAADQARATLQKIAGVS